MLNKFFKIQLYCFIIFALLISAPKSSYAIFDAPREDVKWTDENKCETGKFDYNPFSSNKDLNWELSNPTCIGFITGQGLAIMTAGKVTKRLCRADNIIGRSMDGAEDRADPVPDNATIGPDTLFKSVYRSTLCGKRSQEYTSLQASAATTCASLVAAGLCASAQTQAAIAFKDMTTCCAAYSSYLVAVAIGAATLNGVYNFANKAYKTARVCGNDWNTWKKFDVDGELSTSQDAIWRRGNYEGSYQYCLESIFINRVNSCNLPDVDGIAYDKTSITNKYYREFLYGGKEYEDSACKNPSTWDDNRKLAILGYTGENQRYYMRGSGVISGYSCHRFVLSGNPKFDLGATEAFECCKQRSQNTICIEAEASVTSAGYRHKFCKFGEKCHVAEVDYDIYPAKKHLDFICAKTFSVCPYNHPLGGGTETRKFKTGANGFPTSEAENSCQYLKHCAQIPALPKIRFSDLTGAYIAAACRDLKGDSQNVYSFNSEILPTGNARGFSAPIVQCFKETFENLLLNKAGESRCLNPDEVPNRKGVCPSGNQFKMGEQLTTPSFFIRIQDRLRGIIKMVLTVSITFYGASVLLGGKPIEKKQLFGYIVKLGLLMYFALGNAWQSGFVDGLLGSSQHVAQIMMKIDDESVPENKKDGCQFPRFNANLDVTDSNRFDNPQYPVGKEYLAVWDMLDCKLARAIGYGPNVSVPNLAIMIFAGFITGGLGVVFFLAAFVFAFLLLSLILRAVHIFLLSSVAIIILIYISPVTITMAMFQKTKPIFDNWVKQILGLSLQPVILFAYLGIFIAIFNVTIMGDVSFTGDGREVPKTIDCSDKVVCKKCRIDPTLTPATVGSESSCVEVASCTKEELAEADPNKVDVISVEDKSVYCLFNIAKLRTYNGFEAIGVFLPTLYNFNQTKLDTLVKAAFLMFIFSSFMDQISTLAAKLVGGAQLKSTSPSAFKMGGIAKDVTRGVQKRAIRLAKSGIKTVGGGAIGFARDTIRNIGTMGKSLKLGKQQAQDRVGDSKRSGDDARNTRRNNDNVASRLNRRGEDVDDNDPSS